MNKLNELGFEEGEWVIELSNMISYRNFDNGKLHGFDRIFSKSINGELLIKRLYDRNILLYQMNYQYDHSGERIFKYYYSFDFPTCNHLEEIL